MVKVKRSWDILSKEERKKAIVEITSFFLDERGEEIGIIAAENILDMFLKSSAEYIYNKGVRDAKDFAEKRLGEVLLDLEANLIK